MKLTLGFSLAELEEGGSRRDAIVLPPYRCSLPRAHRFAGTLSRFPSGLSARIDHAIVLLAAFINNEPWWDELRDDKRFQSAYWRRGGPARSPAQ